MVIGALVGRIGNVGRGLTGGEVVGRMSRRGALSAPLLDRSLWAGGHHCRLMIDLQNLPLTQFVHREDWPSKFPYVPVRHQEECPSKLPDDCFQHCLIHA